MTVSPEFDRYLTFQYIFICSACCCCTANTGGTSSVIDTVTSDPSASSHYKYRHRPPVLGMANLEGSAASAISNSVYRLSPSSFNTPKSTQVNRAFKADDRSTAPTCAIRSSMVHTSALIISIYILPLHRVNNAHYAQKTAR